MESKTHGCESFLAPRDRGGHNISQTSTCLTWAALGIVNKTLYIVPRRLDEHYIRSL